MTCKVENLYKLNAPVCFLNFSPAFSKLEQWLENLKMHLDIGLPLVSELDQLHKAFWDNHSVTCAENSLHTHPEQPE